MYQIYLTINILYQQKRRGDNYIEIEAIKAFPLSGDVIH